MDRHDGTRKGIQYSFENFVEMCCTFIFHMLQYLCDVFRRYVMREQTDLIGCVFGDLTVLKRVDDECLTNGHKTAKYLCVCICGNECIVRGTSLVNGHTKSCGCRRKRSMIGVNLEDLTGRRFGRWTVMHRAESAIEPSGRKATVWHCKCDCGTEKDIRASSLKAGTTLSCGCYKANRLGRDLTGQRFGRWAVVGRGLDKTCGKRLLRTWTCVCDCGTVRDVGENSLITGKSVSCGCYRKERAAESITYTDLTGQRFGHWTVLRKLKSIKFPSGYAQLWECKCDCGTVKSVEQSMLKSGMSRSCGCQNVHQLESDVRQYLDEHNMSYKTQFMFCDLVGDGGIPLRYDFCVMLSDGNYLLIECQGEQHYRPVKYFGGDEAFLRRVEYDKRKREYADIHGFLFLEIPYVRRTYEAVSNDLDEFFKEYNSTKNNK